MHVGIDCSSVAKRERTGVARYCVSLLKTLPAVVGRDDRVTLLYRVSRIKRRRWFERIDDPRFDVSVFHDGVVPFGGRGLDVVHGPDLRIPRRLSVPAVSTVHDLSALDVPGIARESFKQRKLDALTDVASRAAVIVCISRFTEQAFLNRFPHAEGRTRVVPLGLAERFRPRTDDEVGAVRERLGLPGRYLLFVGQISARKNLEPLLRAFAGLRRLPGNDGLALVLAGPVQTGGAEILERARAERRAAGVMTPGFVGDDVLPPLYAGAEAFCFTGKAEGFGLPILEAMACGCPVVVGRAGASVSTAGGAALVVDPDDAGELRDALSSILGSADVRDDLRRRGLARAESFSWRETGERTVSAYRDAVRRGVLA